MKFNSLIPELTVSNIEVTKDFYMNILGFSIEYERQEQSFAFLSLGENQLMFEQVHDSGWNVAELEKPYGRGINFEMCVDNVEQLYQRVLSSNIPIYRELKTNTYSDAEGETTQREFLIQDPDGYLLRFVE